LVAAVHPQAIPYLPEEPIASISLDLLPVSRVMKSPVVTFQVCCQKHTYIWARTLALVHDMSWWVRATSYNVRPLLHLRLHFQHMPSLQEKMQIKDLRWALRNTTHNGFPVVRSTQHGEVRSLALHVASIGQLLESVAASSL
jgi:hypothetical protein